MRYWIDSESLEHWLRTNLGRRSSFFGGGEYTSGGFVDFCSEAGIKREFTVSYNPQQNEVAEWKNTTIISIVKAMVHDQGVPMIGRSL